MVPLCGLVRVLPLLGLVTSLATSKREEAKLYEVAVPKHADPKRQVVDASFQSLSIEFFAFLEYSGNSTYSNPLNKNLLGHLRRWGGVPLKIRLGGSSQGRLWWIPDQEQGLIGYYEEGEDKTYNVTIGPAFFDAFDAWPKDTKFTLGMPLTWEAEGLRESAIEIASRLYKKLGQRMVGLELGNERQYLGDDYDFPLQNFTADFLTEAYAVSEAVFDDPYKKIYTIGGFIAPTLGKCRDPNNSTSCWNSTTLFEHGINEKGIARVADTHQYMNTFETGTRVPRQFLMEHNNTAVYVDSHDDLAAYSVAHGVPYIFGETNSLFGHGTPNVSDTFTAALWNIDYTLYTATTNISLLAYHQCFGWRYSAWRPIPAWGYPAGVLPAYYGFWVVQKALGAHGGTSKQVEALVTDDRFTVYGIYEAETRVLSSVIVLNLLDWDSTKGQDDRPEVTVSLDTLATLGDTLHKPKVHRLTAAGADVKDPEAVSFAGQYLAELEGTIQGHPNYETLKKHGKMTLKASEAVLIEF